MFNKLWAKMASVDSFYPFWSKSTSVSKIFGLYISFTLKDISLFLLFFIYFSINPLGLLDQLLWIHMSQTAFWDKLQEAGKKKDAGENMVERGRREKLLWHYGASSIIQMAAVPLHLFSLLGLKIKMATPKKTDIQKTKLVRRARAGVCLTFHISAGAIDEQETVNATDCMTLKRKIFLSRMA